MVESTSWRRPRVWQIFFVAEMLAMAGFLLLPGGLPKDLLYDVLAGIAVGAMLWAAFSRGESLAWALLGLSQALFLAADFTYNVYQYYLHVEEFPFPSAADILYLSGYPLLALGIALLVGERARHSGGAATLDAAMITTGLTMLGWVFLFDPAFDRSPLSNVAKLVASAYPLMDLLVLLIALRLLLGRRRHTASDFLVLLGVGALLLTDLVYSAQLIAEAYGGSPLLDAGWLLSYALLGAGALAPRADEPTAPTTSQPERLGQPRVLALIAALLVPVALVLLDAALGLRVDTIPLIVGTSLMSILVTVRMVGILRDHQRDYDRLQESERRFATLLANTPAMVYRRRQDDRWSLEFVSSYAREITGYSDVELLGGKVSLRELVHPEDLPEVSANLGGVSTPGQRYRLEYRLRRRDGSLRFVEEYGQCVRVTEGMPLLEGLVTDVTDRKRAEQAVQQVQRRYQDIFERISEGIFQTSLDGRLLLANPALARMLGYASPEELLSEVQDVARQIYARPADRDRYLRIMLEEGEVRDFELEAVRKDGEHIWLSISSRWLFDEARGMRIIEGTCQDITQRKRAEEALRESMELFVSAFDHAPIGMALVATDGRWLRVNPSLCRMLGYSERELLGMTFQDITHPEDLELDLQHMRQVLEGEIEQYEMEKRYYHKHGSIVWALLSVSLVRDLDGQPLYFVSQIQDITQRKEIERAITESEERYRRLVEAFPDLIAIVQDGRVAYVNPAGARMLGAQDPQELVGRSVLEFVHPERRGEVAAQIASIGEGGPPPDSIEERFITLDGREIYAEVKVVPTSHKDRPASQIIARDITESRRVAEELRRARDQAIEASRLKSEFVANMSHEIRTPLNAIIGMTELLQDTPLSERQREFVQTIQTSSQSLLSIINDILDFSKIEAGKMVLEEVDFDLVSLVEGTSEMLAGAARGKGISLMTFVDPTIPRTLIGDPARLRQVLLNLLSNAVKFTEQGEVLLRVLPHRAADSEVELLFEVRDTGIGIDSAHLGKLFQPFTQADASTTRRYGGTGLGLTISKTLVELMGGTIWAESQPGVGSTFRFTARFKVAAMERSPTQQLVLPPDLRVLVVDDQAAHRQILRSYLESWHMRCEEAADGAQAMEKAQREHFDLAILDLLLPDTDGFDLAQQLRRLSPSTKLVLLTAHHEQGQGERAVDAGFSAYLLKPIRQSHLMDVLANISARKEPQPQAEQAPSSAAAAAEPPAQGERKPILLAEDNPVNRRLATLQLEKLGYSVRTVDNGREAVEEMARRGQEYCLVLMDCQMPEMDGYEATRQIRRLETKSGRRTPIIALTANALEGDREACLAAGMDDYLSKPLTMGKLKAVLDRWAGTQQVVEKGR